MIARFDACTGTPLSNFATIGTGIIDLEPLSNGQLLIGTLGGAILLYDGGGALVRQVADLDDHALGNFEAYQIALSEDEETPYAVTAPGCDEPPGPLLRLDFATGALLSSRSLAMNYPNSLVVGTAAADSADVPALGVFGLAILAVALAAAAVFALKS